VKELAALPRRRQSGPLRSMKPDNLRGIPLIGARDRLAKPRLPGGVKIAIIDTGIDYTHANSAARGTARPTQPPTRRETAPAIRDVLARRRRASRAAPISSATAITQTRARRLSSRFRTRIRIARLQRPRSHVAGTAAVPGSPRRRDLPRPLQRSDARDAGQLSVGPALRRKPTSTPCACSAARARPTSRRRHRPGRRQHMDVINMSLGSSFARRTIRPRGVDERREGRRHRRRIGRHQASTHTYRLAGKLPKVASRWPQRSVPTSPGATLTFAGTTIPAIDATGSRCPVPRLSRQGDKEVGAGSEIARLAVSGAFGGPPAGKPRSPVVNRGAAPASRSDLSSQQPAHAVVDGGTNAPGFPRRSRGRSRTNPDDARPFQRDDLRFLG